MKEYKIKVEVKDVRKVVIEAENVEDAVEMAKELSANEMERVDNECGKFLNVIRSGDIDPIDYLGWLTTPRYKSLPVNKLLVHEMSRKQTEEYKKEWINDSKEFYISDGLNETAASHAARRDFEEYCNEEGYTERDEHILMERDKGELK